MRNCALRVISATSEAIASRLGAGVLAVVLFAGCGEKPPPPLFTDIGAGLMAVDWCSLAWGDYDEDGDLDLVLAGEDSGDAPLTQLLQNDGNGNFTSVDAGLPMMFHCALAWGDHEADGDLDLAIQGGDGSGTVNKVWRNDAGAFTDSGAMLTDLGGGSVAWGDYENDGDLDLAAAGWTNLGPESILYKNEGGGALAEDAAVTLVGVDWCSLAWGDYDNDGDLDLALAGAGDLGGALSKLYRNDGATLTEVVAGLEPAKNCSLAWGDYDNDGDLDLAIAGVVTGAVCRVYRNDGGTFTGTDLGPQSAGYCSLAWGDYDNDGDLDLAVAGLYPSTGGPISVVYRNDDGTFADAGARLVGIERCSLAWGDYDGDGDLDLALSGSDGSQPVSRIYRNESWVSNTPPTAPTGLSSAIGSGEVTFGWAPATDAETPQPGLTYNLRVGTAANKEDVMPGMSVIGGPNDGWRLIPAMGNVQHNTSWTLTLPSGTYYWSVQAIDTAFAGSPWAPEQTVTVP